MEVGAGFVVELRRVEALRIFCVIQKHAAVFYDGFDVDEDVDDGGTRRERLMADG